MVGSSRFLILCVALSFACGESSGDSTSSAGSEGETAGESAAEGGTATGNASEAGTAEGGGGSCGNGIVEGDEVCDGDDLDGEDCEELGYNGGELTCADDCMSFDVSACDGSMCGDDMIQDPEECDGTALDGQTCEDFGYGGGELACTADCQEYDVSGCVEDCDEDAADACEAEAMEETQNCIDECDGDTCEMATCEAACQENAQGDLEDCYAQAGCLNKAMGADCTADCLEGLEECADETDCDPMCSAEFEACVAAC
jgi:hypothetical protein